MTGLSEHEVEARLTELRHRREVLDREIADLLLYLELGRRLGRVVRQPIEDNVVIACRRAEADSLSVEGEKRRRLKSDVSGDGFESSSRSTVRVDRDRQPVIFLQEDARPFTSSSDRPQAAQPDLTATAMSERAMAIPPAVAFADDPTAARRYGRAIIDASCAAIGQAGRPLHASEILERLVARGFTLPGRDPVAALNTRLWKRATPGGPLKRLGDASYALAEHEAMKDNSGDTEI